MFLSLTKKFVFLANPKAASSTLERALTPLAELASSQGRWFGRHPVTGTGSKHFNYMQFVEVFEPFFKHFSLEPDNFFSFGIIREPRERVQSAYRYFSDPSKSSGFAKNLSFDEFVGGYLGRNKSPFDQRFSQSQFFKGPGDGAGVHFLIRLDQASEHLSILHDLTGLDLRDAMLSLLNPSNLGGADVELADAEMSKELDRDLEPDYVLYDEMSGRQLKDWTPSPELEVDKVLKWMLRGRYRYEVGASVVQKIQERLAREPDFSIRELLRTID